MNRLYNIIVALFLGTLSVACSDGEATIEGTSSDKLLISIDPIVESRATELDFESGDMIGVNVVREDGEVHLDNASLTHTGASFVGTYTWYEDTSVTSTVAAYYPYVEGDTMPTLFTIKADQTADGAYTASDLMLSIKSGVKPSNSSVLMSFSHKLCRIVVEIDNQSSKGVSSVIVGESRPTVMIDFAEQSVSIDTSSDSTDISAPLWSDGTYKAIFTPQSTSLSFTIVYDDGTSVSKTNSDYITYLSGCEYTAKLLLLDGDIDLTIDSEGINGWGDGGSIDVTGGYIFQEYSDYFIYYNERYNTITYSNGIKVMTDNLRYIPDGRELSSDPSDKSGLWYPYSLDLDTSETEALTDSESIATWGYLYNHATAFGVEAVTEDNRATFEGTQGICPNGWHIPTGEEWYMLCGDSQQYSGDDTSAPFYDSTVAYSSIQRANEVGFNHNYAGSIANNKYSTTSISSDYTKSEYVDDVAESVVGKKSTTYYMSSSSPNWSGESSGATFYSLMSSHATAYAAKGHLSVSLGYSGNQGQSVRCIKDRN